jgi:hypothetical protein
MAQLVVPETVDTVTVVGNCTYPATPLGGAPVVSPNITVGGVVAKFYTSASVPSTVQGVPIGPGPCTPGVRSMVVTNNTTVFFNGQLPAVVGDQAQLLGTNRPLVGPYGPATVLIGSSS